MSLDKTITDRGYLYGRLLAVAELLEKTAQKTSSDTERTTNAEKLMQRFSIHPHSTWVILRKALDPYLQILTKNEPGLKFYYDRELASIHDLFDHNDFNNDSKVSGEFLLGYYCQKSEMFPKKSSDKEDKNSQPKE